MAKDVTSIIIALAFWATCAYRWSVRHRQGGNTGTADRRALLGMSVAMTLLVPWTYAGVDRLTGIPNLALLLANSLGIYSAWAYHPVLARLQGARVQDRGLLGSGWLMVGTIATMGALIFLAPVDQSAPRDFMERYAGAPFVAEYRLVLMGYIGAVVYQLFRATLRRIELIEALNQPHRRLEIRLGTVGWGLCLAYTVQQGLWPFLTRLDLVPAPYASALSHALLVGCMLTLLSGGGIRLGHWAARYRAHRRLYPLHRDLRGVIPTLTVNSPFPPESSALADALAVDDLGLRLTSRMGEIEDGLLLLQAYIPAGMTTYAANRCRAAGITGQEADAVIVAASVAVALQRKRRGQRAAESPGPPVDRDPATFTEEIHFLLAVARAYRRSPIVRATLAAWGAPAPDQPFARVA